MNLTAAQARVLAALSEVVADGREATVALIAEAANVGTTTTRAALRAFEAQGLIECVAHAGRPSDYRLLVTPTPDPNATPTPTPTPTPTVDPNGSPLPSQAGAIDLNPREEPGLPTTAPVAREPQRPNDPNAPTPQRPNAEGVVEIGQAVVAWAIDEQRRLGKPELDGALLGKLGSMAKRMSEGGVEPLDLKAAVERLVARDMTALDAAHRQVAGRTRPASDRSALAALARESRGQRDPRSLDPHREDEMVEVWAFCATAWDHEPLPDDETRAAWHVRLRPFPMDCILEALNTIAKRGERWRPTWGQVHQVASPRYREEIQRWRNDVAARRSAESGE